MTERRQLLIASERSDRIPPPTPVRLGAAVADAGARAAFLRATFSRVSANDADPDICAHLFRLCRTLQAEHLDACGINCVFDVDAGRLPRRVCDTLGLIVTALIMDAADHALAGIAEKTIAITLRRRGALWACSVAHSGGRVKRAVGRRSWLSIAEGLAAELGATYRSEATNGYTITAIVFAVDRVAIPQVTDGSPRRAIRRAFVRRR